MKTFIGFAMIATGIILGIYVGVWHCFIGGIVDVIQQIRAEELKALSVAIGIAKILFAGAAGWLSALIFIIPGAGILKN